MLPESESKRINKASKLISPDDIGVESLVNFCQKSEAQLWYERMGKFAKWIEDERWQYKVSDEENHWWYSPIEDKLISTPELINEFLKIK